MKEENEQRIREIFREELAAHDKKKELGKTETESKTEPAKEKKEPIKNPKCGNCGVMVSEGLTECPGCGEPLEW